jgi:hypothetical protein
VEQARRALEEKAEQLGVTSKYKSEFLANMSHELRTPLNSLLILSQQLAENPGGNLTPQQLQFSRTIHSSGTDLLNLINNILDLSKIESGTVTVEISEVRFADLRNHLERTFRHMAEAKGLQFSVELDPHLPTALSTDARRLEQVLKNLLSNSFKFTEKGRIEMRMSVAASGWSHDHEILNRAPRVIAFAVSDTGIGISLDKQKMIFEAFQQADGSTSRKYGGTGLGLAISREIAYLLGGELRVDSAPGQGSKFTLYLPDSYIPPAGPGGKPRSTVRQAAAAPSGASPSSLAVAVAEKEGVETREGILASQMVPEALLAIEIRDDRGSLQPGDRVVLIVEDNATFANLLLDIAREKGFKGVVALHGETALSLARSLKPDAITLDIRLPDVDGWTVLDRLKLDPETRHIPVHIVTVEEERTRGLQRGARAYLVKPVSKESLEQAFAQLQDFLGRPKRLLVVEDVEVERKAVVELIGDTDVQISEAATGEEALAALRGDQFDCMVLDLRLPDMSGFEVLEAMQKEPSLRELPVIVYTGKPLSKQEESRLKRLAREVIVKDAQSPELLLDETALFLHRVAAQMPESKRRVLEQLYLTDTALAGKKVLVVDDDVRNVFAVTAVLERHGLTVLAAESGKAALDVLQRTPDVGSVLMDVMMPEMDGYDTTRAIRKMPHFKTVPVIALTAKAMKGDREKCLEAGMSDYFIKPVNTEQLLSLLRVWLYHSKGGPRA